MLKKVIPNTLIPSIGDFVRIIRALCNRFRSTEISDTLDQLTLTMLQKSKEPNRLLQYLQENELLNKRTVYTELKDWSYSSQFSKIVIRWSKEYNIGSIPTETGRFLHKGASHWLWVIWTLCTQRTFQHFKG